MSISYFGGYARFSHFAKYCRKRLPKKQAINILIISKGRNTNAPIGKDCQKEVCVRYAIHAVPKQYVIKVAKNIPQSCINGFVGKRWIQTLLNVVSSKNPTR